MHIAYNGPVLEQIVGMLKWHDIPFVIDLKREEIIVEGFSKSGTARLVEDEAGVVTAHTRYNQRDQLDSFKDLVRLNNEWFQAYRQREPFTTPHVAWESVLIEYGCVKKVVKEIVSYE